MKQFLMLLVFLITGSVANAAVAEKAVFGPVQYDVKERYGKENVYKGSFKASEGVYLIKLQSGSKMPERVDIMEFTLNGEKLLKEGKYDYNFIAGITGLQTENNFEVVLKDARPSGFKRPPLPPRFIIMTVTPYSGTLQKGFYGLYVWESLKDLTALLQKIAGTESGVLAAASINLTLDVPARAEAMRKLSDRRDSSALPFITAVFNDTQLSPDIRGEAALALGTLGDKKSIPLLINGMLDPDEKTRLGSTRALSFYSEEDTRQPLASMLERLDNMRRDAVIRAVINSGWKPVGTFITLAESKDPLVSRTGVSLLGSMRDPRATDLLLKLFQEPGERDIRTIITSLGETADARAVAPLTSMAKDPARRAGKEAELSMALANLGDKASAGLIEEMIKKTESRQTRVQLQKAYKKLTGNEY